VHPHILSLVSNQTITFNTSQINTFEIDDSMSTQLTLDKHLSRHIADASNDCTMIKTNALSIGHQIFISNLDRSSTQTSINLRVEPHRALQCIRPSINLINRNQYIENNAITTV
jgi:hypothetical protein